MPIDASRPSKPSKPPAELGADVAAGGGYVGRYGLELVDVGRGGSYSLGPRR